MRKPILLGLLCVAFGLNSAWASVTGSTDPTLFQDAVDWCVQYGCVNTPFQIAAPAPWTSAGGNTGMVGNAGSALPLQVWQQSVSWIGNYPANMGGLYNGFDTIGNPPDGLAATFNLGLYGAGAYIQANLYGPFTATVTLFDSSLQPLGSYTANGSSDTLVGTALFIGAYINTPSVWAVRFDVVDANGDNSTGIGTMRLQTSSVPEPCTLMLVGTSALGLLGVVRRRL